jgi:broad specificity phosphatase PhoE
LNNFHFLLRYPFQPLASRKSFAFEASIRSVSRYLATVEIQHTDASTVAPTIHFVRHAEVSTTNKPSLFKGTNIDTDAPKAYHNVKPENNQIYDPKLTPLGERQCHKLRDEFPLHKLIDLLVSSPLSRTVYTTLLSFTPGTERGLKVIALPELQEVGDFPCDTGSDLEVLKKELEDKPVDLSLVPEDWNSKKGEWKSTEDKVNRRASKTRLWLKARPEKNIVVVTHGGLVHYLTGDWTDNGKFAGAYDPKWGDGGFVREK